jgi:hypothetical protein
VNVAPGNGDAAARADSEGMGVDPMRINVGGTSGSSGTEGGGGGSGGASSAAGASAEGGAAGADVSGGVDGNIDVPASTRPVLASLGSCAAFTPCGGALDGNWTYASVCIEPAEISLDQLESVCPGSSVTLEDGAGAALSFAGGQVARSGEVLGEGSLSLPIDCVDSLLGGCAELGLSLDLPCAESVTSCTCTYSSNVGFGQQPVSVSGSAFVLGDGRAFDYCVEGDELRYRETGDAQEDGLYTLVRN